MIDVCTRYEEHLSLGSRITRDVIAEQQRTDLIYQRSIYKRLLECSKGVKTITIEGVFHIFLEKLCQWLGDF